MLRATIKRIGFRSCSLRRWAMLRFSTVLLTAVIILGLSVPKLTENAQASTGTPDLNDKVLYTQSDFADLKPVPDSYQIAKAYFLPDYQEDMGGIEADPVDQCASLCPGYSKGLTSCPEGYTLEKCSKSGCGTYGRCVNNCPATVTLSSAEICLETCGGNCVKKEACPTSSLSVPNADKTACVCPEQYQKSCPANSIKGDLTCSANGETYYKCFCEAGYKCSQAVTYSTGCTGSCVKETASCSQGDYYENSTARAEIYKQWNSHNGIWVQTSLNSNSFCGYCRPKTCQELNSSYKDTDDSTETIGCTLVRPVPVSAGQQITCYKCDSCSSGYSGTPKSCTGKKYDPNNKGCTQCPVVTCSASEYSDSTNLSLSDPNMSCTSCTPQDIGGNLSSTVYKCTCAANYEREGNTCKPISACRQALNNNGLTVPSTGKVLTVFGASWAGPSVVLKNTIESNQDLITGCCQTKYQYVDVDTYSAVAQTCSATSVPTSLYHYYGTEMGRKTGNMSLSDILSFIGCDASCAPSASACKQQIDASGQFYGIEKESDFTNAPADKPLILINNITLSSDVTVKNNITSVTSSVASNYSQCTAGTYTLEALNNTITFRNDTLSNLAVSDINLDASKIVAYGTTFANTIPLITAGEMVIKRPVAASQSTIATNYNISQNLIVEDLLTIASSDGGLEEAYSQTLTLEDKTQLIIRNTIADVDIFQFDCSGSEFLNIYDATLNTTSFVCKNGTYGTYGTTNLLTSLEGMTNYPLGSPAELIIASSFKNSSGIDANDIEFKIGSKSRVVYNGWDNMPRFLVTLGGNDACLEASGYPQGGICSVDGAGYAIIKSTTPFPPQDLPYCCAGNNDYCCPENNDYCYHPSNSDPACYGGLIHTGSSSCIYRDDGGTSSNVGYQGISCSGVTQNYK